MVLLLRDSWLKPLYELETGAEKCTVCGKEFKEVEFVTTCEFCNYGIMHTTCADNHIITSHLKEIEQKIKLHRDRPLHRYQ